MKKRLYYYELCVNWIEVDKEAFVAFNELSDDEQAEFLMKNGVEDLNVNLYIGFKNSGIKILQPDEL